MNGILKKGSGGDPSPYPPTPSIITPLPYLVLYPYCFIVFILIEFKLIKKYD